MILKYEEDTTDRIKHALGIAFRYSQIDGAHHKAWSIDQMIRALTNCPVIVMQATNCNGELYEFECLGESQEYRDFVTKYEDGEDGPKTYFWDTGIAP